MKKHMSDAADRLQNLDRRNLSTHSLASAYHKLATSFMSIVSCVMMLLALYQMYYYMYYHMEYVMFIASHHVISNRSSSFYGTIRCLYDDVMRITTHHIK